MEILEDSREEILLLFPLFPLQLLVSFSPPLICRIGSRVIISCIFGEHHKLPCLT